MRTSHIMEETHKNPLLSIIERQLSPNAAPAFPPSFYAESRAEWVLVPASVFTVVCPLLVAVRFWARRRTVGQVAIDDWTCLASLVRDTVTLLIWVTS